MTERSTPLKLGIIGCGWVTETYHLPALRALPGVDIVAVADGDPDRLKRVADRFHVRQRQEDYVGLLNDPTIEAVGVWAPPDYQVEIAQAVLRAGKHLFIDKPMVLDLDPWDRLIELAAQSHREIMVVGLPRRWHRHMFRAREVIRQGTLGKLEMIRTVLTGRNPERRTVQEEGNRYTVKGILYQFGVHHFDVLHCLLQRDIEEIFAAKSPNDSTVAVTARLSDGLLVSSMFSESESRNDEVELYGQTDRLRISCYRFDGFEHFPAGSHPGDLRTRARQLVRTLHELPRGLIRMRQGGDFLDSYRVGWQHCLDAIRHQTRPDCTLADARRVLQVILAAIEAASLGQPVKVAQTPRRR